MKKKKPGKRLSKDDLIIKEGELHINLIKVKKKQPRKHISKIGTRADLGIFVRSKMEANWARWLSFQIKHKALKSWEYEPDEFEFPVKRGNRFYKPDFKVTENNGAVVYHEVKGYMDAQSKTKLKRMAKYYPEIKIIIIDIKAYNAVAKKVCTWIAFWE